VKINPSPWEKLNERKKQMLQDISTRVLGGSTVGEYDFPAGCSSSILGDSDLPLLSVFRLLYFRDTYVDSFSRSMKKRPSSTPPFFPLAFSHQGTASHGLFKEFC